MSRYQLLLPALLAVFSGCSPMQKMSGNLWRSMHYTDTDNPADSKGDPWVQSAGEITRTEHTREEVHDPLKLRNVFMSEQARSIERNVGVGE